MVKSTKTTVESKKKTNKSYKKGKTVGSSTTKLVKNTNLDLFEKVNKTTGKRKNNAKDINKRIKDAVKTFCDRYYDQESNTYSKIPNIFAICQIAKVNYKSLIQSNGSYQDAYNFLKCWIANVLIERGDFMACQGKRTDWWRFRLSVYLPREPIQVESKSINMQIDMKMLPIAQKALKDLNINNSGLTNKDKDCATVDEALLKKQSQEADNADFVEVDQNEEEESEFNINDFIPSDLGRKEKTVKEAMLLRLQKSQDQDQEDDKEGEA